VRQTTRLIELAEEAGFTVTIPKAAADRGGTFTVGHDDAAAITRELVRRDFIVDFRPGAGIRISPHFYTSDEEIELIVREMKDIRDTRAYTTHEAAGAAF
jgi:kynureninase